MFSRLLLLILGMPKTLYFNFKYLALKDAIRLPILVSHRVYMSECKGQIDIEAPIKYAMIKIGFGDVGIFDKQRSRSIWQVGGKVIFKGKANIGHGSKISVGGILTLGANMTISAESQIVCQKEIIFGDNVLLSWESLFMDTDFHKILIKGEVSNLPRAIVIGNNVWISCRCTILKGSTVCDNTVIAANSLVSGSFKEQNTIIGGNPARVIKKGIDWLP